MSTIQKSVFSLQRLARDPILVRKVSRQTGMSPDEVREEISSLRSERQPLVGTIRKIIDENGCNSCH